MPSQMPEEGRKDLVKQAYSARRWINVAYGRLIRSFWDLIGSIR